MHQHLCARSPSLPLTPSPLSVHSYQPARAQGYPFLAHRLDQMSCIPLAREDLGSTPLPKFGALHICDSPRSGQEGPIEASHADIFEDLVMRYARKPSSEQTRKGPFSPLQ